MALMPEDLLNKRFTPVRFSEGYDMDEVDNYLDNDVMPRLQELIDENSRLTKELEEAHNRIAELENGAQDSRDAGAAPTGEDASADAPVLADDEITADASTLEADAATDAPVTEAVVVEEQTEVTGAAPVAPTVGDPTDQSAAGIIALAHRLHDEHVKNGEDERDRLIAEANAEHRRIVGEAEETSRSTLERLETQKAELEESIEGLRTFERDYRNRLRNYLEDQLRQLDTSDTQDHEANLGL